MPEDVQGLPDVQGLQNLVSDEATPTQTKSETQTTKTTTEQQTQTPNKEELDLAQFGNDPMKLLKGYKEVQGAFTRTSQENKTLKEQLNQLNEQMELIRLSQMRQQPVQQVPQQDFDQQFINNPQKAIETLAEQKAQNLVLQSKIQDVLEEESLKNPSEFNERYAYAKIVSQQYPQLVTSSAGVRKLFQIGDKLRSEQQKQQAVKAVKAVFGEDVDFEKFRQVLKKDSSPTGNINNAYMPDTTGAIGNRTESQPTNVTSEITEAVKKGDPDAVIKGLFKQVGL
jgi:hypothetical protein